MLFCYKCHHICSKFYWLFLSDGCIFALSMIGRIASQDKMNECLGTTHEEGNREGTKAHCGWDR